MSTDIVKPVFFWKAWWESVLKDQYRVRVLRFSVGVTLSAALAYAINWPLSFLLPVLVTFFLSLPVPVPPVMTGLKNMKQTLLAFSLGLMFALFFIQFPMLFLVMLGLTMFHLYYYLNRGGSVWFTLMSFISILLLSMLANSSGGLAVGVSIGFVTTSWVTVLMVWVAYFLVPDPQAASFPPVSAFKPGYSEMAAQTAIKSTLVILPLAALFFIFNLLDYMVVMIFSALFILKPELSKGQEAGKNSLISTLLGGAYAWLFYWLLVAVPEYYFYVFLMFLTALVFGRNIFSGSDKSKYYGSALIALLILVNGSMAEGAEFSEKLIARVGLISLSVIYIVSALKLLEYYWPGNKDRACKIG